MGAAAPEPAADPGSAALPRVAGAFEWLERESLLVLIAVLYVAALFVRLPYTLGADSWLTFVAGRELWEHGLPATDALTTWAGGERWVDQQWLAQLAFGALERTGGIKLALLGHAALVGSAFLAAAAAGRRFGGSARAAALVAVLALPQLAQQWQLRAQSFAYVLFVALLVLLVADIRSPGRRVLLCLPLLALWGNLHGSVLVGAALVSVRGLLLVRERRTPTGAALVLAPWICMLASPYAVDLPRYYAGMLGGHDFSALVVEWAPATPGLMTAPFYALAFAAVALLARRRSASAFEQLALAVTLAGGMLAVRNMVWFSLAAMVVLPRLLALELPAEKGEAGRAVKVGLPLAAAVLSAAVLAAVVTRPAAWYDRSAGAGSVAEAVAANPGLPLLAPLDDADRLLWEEPGLRARIAYDARLELLSDDELRRVYEWQNRIGDWPSIAGCPALALVDAAHARELPRARTLQRDASGSLLLLNCAE